MFATTSPRAHTRRLSNGSFNSDPDMDIDSNEEHNNYTPGGGGGLGISGVGVGVGAGGNGNGLLRPPNAGLGTPSRPPRDSLVRQSLHSYPAANPPPAYPPLNGEPPRRSFIPPAEYGYYDPPLSRANTRPPTQYRTAQFPPAGLHPPFHEPSHDSHSYVTERMEIAGEREPRASRLKRFAKAFLKPFKAVKSVFRMPRYLRIRWRGGGSTVGSPRPITQSSGWDFRDRTPAPTSVGHQISNEDGELRTNVGAGSGNNVTMLFPEPQVSPPPVGSIGHDNGGRGPRSSGGTDSAHGHSVTHQSHSQPHSYAHVSPQDASHRSNHSHLHSHHGEGDTIKANVNGGAGVRSSDSHTQSHSSHSRSSRSTESRFSAFSPVATSRIFAGPPKEDASSRGGRRLSLSVSMKSHCSSLLHQFRLIFEAFRALYHLPWVADPPKRIAADFIPAFGARSKYRVQEQQRHRQWKSSNRRTAEGEGRGWVYPPEVLIAAAAAKNMEPNEGKSWYRPSPAQLEKMMKRRGPGSTSTSSTHDHGHGNGHYHAHHGHGRRRGHEQGNYFYNPQTLANAYQTLFADDARGRHTQPENQPMFVVGQPLNVPGFGPPPTFPQPFGGATMGPGPGTFYIVPGPPPPFPTAQVAPQVNRSTSQAHQAGAGANAKGANGSANVNGGGLRPPPPTRPPSAMSVSFRQGPGPRPARDKSDSSDQPQPQTSHPNSITPNPNPSNQNLAINVARPPPAAVAAPTQQQQQQVYMLVQAPPLSAPGLAPHPSHLPPSYNSGGGINIYPYPYTPPWTPPSQRM